MIRVSKTQLNGRPGFVAQWRTSTGKNICRGIRTRDELRADEIVANIQRVLNTPALEDPNHPDHAYTMPEAYKAIFGRDRPPFGDEIMGEIEIPNLIGSKFLTADGQVVDSGISLPPYREVAVVHSKQWQDAQEKLAALTRRNLVAEEKIHALQTENLRQARQLNKHCKTVLSTAIDEFDRLKTDVSKASKERYLTALKDFCVFLGSQCLKQDYVAVALREKSADWNRALESGGEFKVAEIRGEHVDDFLASRPDKKTGKPITARRRFALKRELSAPYHFWVRRYELTMNAFDHSQPITGHQAVAPDSREMIRTVEELTRLLWALGQEMEKALYWKAFVATAALTGADLSTLFELTPRDVVLEEPTRVIMCRGKTGRQRDTPIERTVLLPILREYLGTVQSGQAFLFPSTLPPRKKRRREIPPGRCSGASAFSKTWKQMADRCVKRVGQQYHIELTDCGFCQLGPRAWRRSAVTFMSGAGCLPRQAARWVGLSVSMADRHYLGRVERNGLVFESTAPAPSLPTAPPAAAPKQRKARTMRPQGVKEALEAGSK